MPEKPTLSFATETTMGRGSIPVGAFKKRFEAQESNIGKSSLHTAVRFRSCVAAAELGVHPAEEPRHELMLRCRDIDSTVAELRSKGVDIPKGPTESGFGVVTTIVLPGGVEVLLYQPKHHTSLGV